MHSPLVAEKSLKMSKGLIRSRYSKYRQCKGKKKTRQNTNNAQQNDTPTPKNEQHEPH